MSRYYKTIAALLGAVGTWLTSVLADGQIRPDEWGGLFVALGTVAAVWGVPNSPPEGEPADLDVSERDG